MSLIVNNCVALFLMYNIREQGPTSHFSIFIQDMLFGSEIIS
jgi:hypothetical protein